MTGGRNDGARSSNALLVTAVATAISSLILAVFAAITPVPDGIVLGDVGHAEATTRWVVVLAGLSVVVAGGAIAGRRLPQDALKVTVVIGFGLMAVAAYLGVQPLRKRLATDLDALSGPGESPTTRFALFATTLAIVALVCGVASLAEWARHRTGTHPFPRRTTLVLATVVITAVSSGWAAAWTARAAIDHGALSAAPPVQTSAAPLPLRDADHIAFRAFVADGQTATVDGQLIIVDSTSVSARDLQTGRVRWTRDRTTIAGDGDLERRPQALVVDRGEAGSTLILRSGSRTAAVDTDTGAVRWWSDATLRVLGAASGVVVAVHYVETRAETPSSEAEFGTAEFVGLDARSGRVRWTTAVPSYDSDCVVEGAVIGEFALVTGCGGGVHPIRVSDGRTMPISENRRRAEISAAGSTFLVRYPVDSTTYTYEFVAPGTSSPIAPGTEEEPRSPLVDGVFVSDRRFSARGFDLDTVNPTTGARVGLDLRSQHDSRGPAGWTEADGLIYGSANAGTTGFNQVIATVDPRTRTVETMPAPCLRGGPSRVTPVGDRIIVECSNSGADEYILEVVALRAG